MWSRLRPWAAGASLLSTPLSCWGIDAEPLQLLTAAAIEGPAHLEPSGLAVCAGSLLLVSDKHDDAVFALKLANGHARAEVVRRVRVPPPPNVRLPALQALQRWGGQMITGARWDWEGISCDNRHNLYLLSESYAAVLKVQPDGRAQWLGEGLYELGRSAALLDKYNAFVEGIAWTPGALIVTAEREPRGLIRLGLDQGRPEMHATTVGSSHLPAPTAAVRTDDFSDLLVDQNRLYTLERNHSAICRRQQPSFAIERCWSYAHVEGAREYGYADARYGLAEGLAVHDGRLYVVLDNNDKPRHGAPDDRRALVYAFRLPASWVE